MSSPQEPAKEMTISGVPASPGIALGRVHIVEKAPPVIKAAQIEDDKLIPRHIERFKRAREVLQNRWKSLKEEETNEESRDILSAQIEIITDPDLANQVELYINKERHSAQHAIDKAFTNYIDILSESESESLKNRMIDLSDIRDRLIEVAGKEKPVEPKTKGDILIAKELSPREVIQLSHQNVKGFVLENGGHTSHAAIIARSMGIPAIVGAKGMIDQLAADQLICLNGENGVITINPSSETCERLQAVDSGALESPEDRAAVCKKPSQTADGHSFVLQANVEFPEELAQVKKFCAEGIGLLRTESVYLDNSEFCNTRTQVPVYREIMEKTDDQPVTIRLFDIGGDKFQGDEVTENNPFLGWRGIRMLLDERELLREQLRAILTVSATYPGRIKILIPMVSSVHQIDEVKKEIKLCRRQLMDEGLAPDQDIPLGIMVEIPSTAIQAQHFIKEIDFISIGTNDLTQYLLAVDRGNALLSGLYSQQHPVVWKIIDHVVKSAQKEEVNVEICGELASYPVATACLLGLGVDTFSMSPVSIPRVKKVLLYNTHTDMKELAEQVLLCENVEEVNSLFSNWNKTYINE